jgi:uncharacterized protein (TIGR03790 family)
MINRTTSPRSIEYVLGAKRGLLALLCSLVWALPAGATVGPAPSGLTASDLGLIINESDPLSVQIGDYYQRRRGVPLENVIRVRMTVAPSLSRTEFARVWKEVQTKLPPHVQALALAWSQPFRVECMSITSAFAFGYSAGYCVEGCEPTAFSVYFDSSSHTPYKDFGIRPAMLVAGRTFEEARALIDRGFASDGTAPRGTAYLMDTSDSHRNARAGSFGFAKAMEGEGLGVQVLKADALKGRSDVVFYFTGVMRVADLKTNKFMPGALADHLTSLGGVLSGSDQMSSLDWLEAGATASYGTVVEPCNFPGKFPNIPIVMRHYLDGETAIESYWKSVMMPAQGVFIGEPLAAPYRGTQWVGIAQARQQQARVSAHE